MTAFRQLLECVDRGRSDNMGSWRSAPLQTLGLIPKQTRLLTLAAVTICMMTVAGASLVNGGSQAIWELCTTTSVGRTSQADFLAENAAAMKKMMNDMDIKPTGNVDLDFVAMMVPHHQGAIDMALAVLRHGRNQRLKRMAQEIIITQQQEIAAMHLAVGRPLPVTPQQASPPSEQFEAQ